MLLLFVGVGVLSLSSSECLYSLLRGVIITSKKMFLLLLYLET